jgi:hypothetical protein
MRSLIACGCLLTAACLQLDTGDGSDAGTMATAASSASGDAAGGTACALDPTGSVTLCEEINACPGLGVDPTAYANCGFRLGGAAPLDLECVCGTSLCPIGVASSCTVATQLLAAQNAITVCEQASEARCLQLSPADAGAGASTCTPDCRTQCAGVLDCLATCGC